MFDLSNKPWQSLTGLMSHSYAEERKMHAITATMNPDRPSYAQAADRRKRAAENPHHGGANKRPSAAAAFTHEAMDTDSEAAAAAVATPAGKGNPGGNHAPRKPAGTGNFPKFWERPIQECPAYNPGPTVPALTHGNTATDVQDYGLCKRCRVTRAHKAEQCTETTPTNRTSADWFNFVANELRKTVNIGTTAGNRRGSFAGGAGTSKHIN
jgi:hypothetical protein